MVATVAIKNSRVEFSGRALAWQAGGPPVLQNKQIDRTKQVITGKDAPEGLGVRFGTPSV